MQCRSVRAQVCSRLYILQTLSGKRVENNTYVLIYIVANLWREEIACSLFYMYVNVFVVCLLFYIRIKFLKKVYILLKGYRFSAYYQLKVR